VSSRLRAAAIDLRPLRRPAYRRLWFGSAVSVIGTQLTAVAVLLQVYAITKSSFAVGLVGLFGFIGLVGVGLYGGSVADAVDRRRLSLVTSSGLALLSGVLVLQAVLDLRSVPLLYGVILFQAALFGIDSPARQAMIPRLLDASEYPAANALSQISMNAGFTIGPLLAGLLVAANHGSFWLPYGIDALTFTAALYAVWRLPPMPPHGGGTRAGVASVVEGFRFLGGQPVLLMSFLVDIVAMVFGMPRALFPAIAGGFYGGGAATVGVLTAAIAVGAIVPVLLSGLLRGVHRHGQAVVVSILVWGAAIAAFGFTRQLWLGLLCLAVAGAADAVSAVFRSTILQEATPDALRGRLSGVFIVVVAGGPRLGDVESGSVAALTSTEFAVVSGGVACIAGVLALAAAVPAFVRFDARKLRQKEVTGPAPQQRPAGP
jgi:MFS family permease